MNYCRLLIIFSLLTVPGLVAVPGGAVAAKEGDVFTKWHARYIAEKARAKKTAAKKTIVSRGSTKSARYTAMIRRHARSRGVPVRLAQAVVRVESSYNPRARGRAGEIGLMQIMPATARGIGYRGKMNNLYQPDTNLYWGMKYLALAYRKAGGNLCGTILRYNAGLYAKRMNRHSARYCRRVKTILKRS